MTTPSFAQAPTFNALVTTDTGNPNYEHPQLAGVGDFNGDGKLDALVIMGSENLRLMLGNGNGTFTLHALITPGAGNQYSVKVADLNGDGRLDAITASNQGNLAAAVLINTGNVAGVPQFSVTNYTNPGFGTSGLRSLTVGDLNGDGNPDFIVGNANGGLRVWMNNGNGTFTGGQYFNLKPGAGGPSVGPGVIADMNADGKADYLVSSNQNWATNIFWGNGDGTFQATTPTIISSLGQWPVVADVNNDGKPDFLEVDSHSYVFNAVTGQFVLDQFGQYIPAPSSSKLMVYLNNGNGTFTGPTLYSTGLDYPATLALTDMNGDGKKDVVTSDFYNGSGTNNVAVLLGNGDGTFGAPNLHNATRRALDLAVGDFNSDGKPDIATVGFNDNKYGVLLNTTPSAITPLVNGTRTTTNGEAWKQYSTTFTPTITGNYTLKFFIPPDNTAYANSAPAIYLDDVRVTSGATELFRSGFESPVIASGGFTYFAAPNYSTGSVTAGDWVYYSTSGIINGAGLAWDSNHTAQEGNQRAVLQAAPPSFNRYGAITTASTMALTAGQTYTATFWQASRTGTGFSNGTLTNAVAFNYVPPSDSTAPVITGPGNLIREATSAAGAVVNFTATATDNVDGPVAVVASPASGSTFAIGTTPVGLAASDAAGNTDTGSFTITVRDTTAPTITSVPANQVIEATSAAGAVATFGAATATDAVGPVTLTYSAASGSTFAIGATTVTVTAKDAYNNNSTSSFSIKVQDTAAPAITSLSTNAPTLWPPNHKMVAVTVSAAASDLVGVASLKIVSVTSNEPDNGLGDGDTANDIQITGNLTVNLRAERGGGGNGRIYTITVEAKDAAGNASTKTVAVTVPKNQNGK